MKFLLPLTALAVSGASASPSRWVGMQQPRRHIVRREEANGSFIATTAPRDNIFADISDDEVEEIMDFLADQQNVTMPGDVTFSEWSRVWLLAPNKTEATEYLDGDGEKPDRYARIMGQGECYLREYMIGPLPVGNGTKATPLDYVLGGNATVGGLCSDEGPFAEDEPSDEVLRKRGLRRRDPTNPYEEEMLWNGDELPNDDKQPPVAILPDGARHEFDPKENYVSWMDFTFYVATGPGGISLHDVRFQGERVIYELAMQEALAHYAGPDQMQTQASYLDVTIGFNDFNLIPGYDCPSYATYTDAFCLFEFQKDYPMSRHLSYGSWLHGTKNVAFMVRSISTVGNYDYMTTYEFHYDGTINVIVRASGYIQASTLVEGDEPWEYGFRIREDLSGSMHDHVLNFKADLDILGTKNSLFRTEFVPHSQVYDWSDGETVNTMKVDRSFVESEDDGRINWAANSAAAYSVVNKDEPNEFGEYPGFRIFPSTGSTTHLTVENSTQYPGQINWATHHFYAVQRKDTEPVSSHPAGGYSSGPAIVDFNDFFDGDSLDQEDLVLYFNLGMHHMPDTYDLPVTVFQGAQSGITLRPVNYQRSDASVSTRQQIHIELTEEDIEVETYGVEELSGSYDLADASPPWTPYPRMPDGY